MGHESTEPAHDGRQDTTRVFPVGDHRKQSLRLRHSLVALLELSRELSGKLDIYSISDIALNNFVGQIGTASAAIWVLPPEDEDPILLQAEGIPRSVGEAVGRVMGARLVEKLRGSPSLLIGDQVHEGLSDIDSALIRDAGIHILSPLVARGSVIGFLGFGKPVGTFAFDAQVVEVLKAGMSIVSTALDNAMTHGRMIENNRRLQIMNEDLTQSNRMKTEFLSTLDHELRTPLTVIIAYHELLREIGEYSEQQLEFFDILDVQTKSLNELILTLLDWKSLVEDNLEVHLVTESVLPWLVRLYEERLPSVTSDFRKLVLETEQGLPPAQLDPVRLVQILDALLDNARKFTPQGSTITIGLTRDSHRGQDWIRIDVADNGPGIPQDKINSVFESFNQVEDTMTRTRGGVGLGLTLARKLAEKMNGRLEIESRPGEGTRVILRLPAVDRRAS